MFVQQKIDDMNKYVKVAIAVLVLSFIFIYFFIPNEIKVTQSYMIPQPSVAVARSLTSLNTWNQWMPAKKLNQDTVQLESGFLCFNQSLLSTVNTTYNTQDFSVPVVFFATAKGKDTSLIEYESIVDNRHVSPFDRISVYWKSLIVKSQMNKVLTAAANFYTQTENIYGIKIIPDRVKDSVLISTNKTFTDTPTVQAQYEMIQSLEKYIQKNNGQIHGAPMVNITKIGEAAIFTQVAYPLAKSIPVSDQFQIKKMVLGNILTVTVTGDNQKVIHAFNETENFIHERTISSPAIPFIVYNTNRLTEKDASKWKSTIYYPVY